MAYYNKNYTPLIFLCRNLCNKKNKRESDNIAVIAVAISLRPKSALKSCSESLFPNVSSRQMNSQQEFPTRNDLQS